MKKETTIQAKVLNQLETMNTFKNTDILLTISKQISVSALKKCGCGSVYKKKNKNGDIIECVSQPLQGATDIIFSGFDSLSGYYNDPLAQDLQQEIATWVYQSVVEGVCSLAIVRTYTDNDIIPKTEHRLFFYDMDTIHDKSEYFVKAIYSSVRRYLMSLKQIKGNKWLTVPLESIQDNDGEVKQDVSIKDSAYRDFLLQTMDIDDLIALESYKKAFKETLKDRDYEVFNLLCNGVPYRTIADELNITYKTVQCTVNRIRTNYMIKEKVVYHRVKKQVGYDWVAIA